MANDDDCLFCKIVAGEVPAEVVHRTETTLAFRDVQPQAPTHVLVVSRAHAPDAAALSREHPGVLDEMVGAAAAVAEQDGLDRGYRLVFNTGPDAHQSVHHVHVHVLGGRSMLWPPG
jgi:histidine triad (HIT) family protein